MNNIYFFRICLLLIPVSVCADEAELEQQCARYREELTNTGQNSVDYSYTDGLLWKIEKDGKVSYLFGTMHTQDPGSTNVPPQVRVVMIQTDVYLTEVEQGPVANQTYLDAVYMKEGKTLKQYLHPEIFGLLKYKAGKYGIDADRAGQLYPWAAFSLIGRPRPTGALTLDQVLMIYAISRKHEVHALETMPELIASLNSIPLEDQIEILTDTLCNHDKILKNARELLNLYIHADVRDMVRFNSQPHRDEDVFNRYIEIMVNKRNERMLERMQPWIANGRTFISIGTSHLTGKNGLLARLVEIGYTVENIF